MYDPEIFFSEHIAKDGDCMGQRLSQGDFMNDFNSDLISSGKPVFDSS